MRREADPSDDARFSALFVATQTAVRAVAARIVPDAAAVDDVVADVYLVAWRRLDEVPEDPAASLRWLFGVARYASANAQRAARRRSALRDRVHATPDRRRVVIPPDDDGDDGRALAAAFARLGAADRAILLLAGWDGLGVREIGDLLGCSRGAAATRLSRARARLEEEVSLDGRTDAEDLPSFRLAGRGGGQPDR